MMKKKVKCAKCSGKMEERVVHSMAVRGTPGHIYLSGKKLGFLGSSIIPFYCEDCGYVEFYADKRKCR